MLHTVLSILAAIVAAGLWWRASHQPPPASFELRATGELDPGFQNWVRGSARANQHAAIITAVAVLLQGLASIVQACT